MTFEDHYSGHADAYARHRPRYPAELFTWLASVTPGRSLAWDAGTGNGQVAIALTEHFDRVMATDASADQLSRAVAHERIAYRNEPAGRVPLPAASVDLITAGAAAHWFELDDFYNEARRVGASGGVVALFSYGPRDIARSISPIVERFNDEILDRWWPERIEYVHDRYARLPFPFEEIAAPTFEMSVNWNAGDVLAFLETWSASQRYLQHHGRRATDAISRELEEGWGASRREIQWPVFMRAGRV